MAKYVDVVKEVVVTYHVDGATSDEEALRIVRKRLDAEAPIDIVSETSKVKSFVVKDTHEPPKE